MKARSSAVLLRSAVALVAAFGCASALARTSQPRCDRLPHAEVVAFEQAVVLNRFGAFNHGG